MTIFLLPNAYIIIRGQAGNKVWLDAYETHPEFYKELVMKRMVSTVLAVVLAGAVSSTARADFCAEQVKTGQGIFTGMVDQQYSACVYKGIPFAKPPVGDLRLKRPEPPLPHEGVFEAVKFGPACLQEQSILNGGKAESYGEDCLYLNVWRPEKEGRFPVMVWLYGGAFAGGAGSFDIYDGAHLASRQDVVVVTINYRLAAYGFFALPELKDEDPKKSTGNYGIQDQARALEWVRDNIGAFRGDPANVTVFGQSAGAMSVCALLVSPESQGLFHRAMLMSGPCRLMTTEEDGYAKSRALLKKMGCEGNDVLSCLRSKPAEAFKEKYGNDMIQGGTPWAPTVDGSFLPAMPMEMIQQGDYHKVPVLIGTTRDELRMYTMLIPGLGAWSRGTVTALMKFLTGDNSKAIMEMYSYKDFRRPIDLAISFGNQMVFDTPGFMMAEAMAKNNPVYMYRFDWDRTRFPHKMGAFHAVDVPFVFGAFNADVDLAKMLASKKTYEKYSYLGYIMMDYVTNFAKTGNPNGQDHPVWPAYAPEDRERLYFNVEITHQPLSEMEVTRYRWYAARDLKEVLTGSLSKNLEKK